MFDSGVGGLSVLRQIRRLLPEADLFYVADRGRAPYGPRSLSEVRQFSLEIADWLLAKGASTLVVACNTASAAGLDQLRFAHPAVPIVGMEPAVKPAAAATRTGVIAVFATAATFQGRLFESVVSRFTEGVTVMQTACPEWVAMVESGLTGGPTVEKRLRSDLRPAIAAGADTIVLGCTHFSFLGDAIQSVVGDQVIVIDPAEAVARQTARVSTHSHGSGTLTLAASGDRDRFALLAMDLAGLDAGGVVAFP